MFRLQALLILIAIPKALAMVGGIAVQNTVNLQKTNTAEDTVGKFTYSDITHNYYTCVKEFGGPWTVGVFDINGVRLQYRNTGTDCIKLAVDSASNLFLLRSDNGLTAIEKLDANLGVVTSRTGASNSIKIDPNGSKIWASATADYPSSNLFALSTTNLNPLLSIAVPGIASVSESAVDSSGNIYAIGYASTSSSPIVVKMSNTGSLVWSQTIPSVGNRPSVVSLAFNAKSNEIVGALYSLNSILGYACADANGCSVLYSLFARNGSLSWSYRNPESWSITCGAAIDSATGDIFYAYISARVPPYNGFGHLRQFSSSGVNIAYNVLFPFYSDILTAGSTRVVVLQDRGGLIVASLPAVPFYPSSSFLSATSSSIMPLPSSALLMSSMVQSASSVIAVLRELETMITSSLDETQGTSMLSGIEETQSIPSSTAEMSIFNSRKNRATSSARRVETTMAESNGDSIVFRAVVACLCLALIIAALAGCFFWRKPRNTYKTGITDMSTTYTGTSQSQHYGENHTNVGQPTTLINETKTAVNTDMGFALPGYLYQRKNIDYDAYQAIAKGGGGTVYLARPYSNYLREFGATIIVKQLNSVSSSRFEIESFYQEVTIMNDLRSSTFIATILGYSDDPFSIIMKYYEMGSLRSFLKRPPFPITKLVVSIFSSNVASGLLMMHFRGIAHCDIKLDNILLERDQNGNLKCVITDFGVSCVVDNRRLLVKEFKVRNLNAASISYASPEILQRLRNPTIVEISTDRYFGDIYAWSMVLYAILHKKTTPYG